MADTETAPTPTEVENLNGLSLDHLDNTELEGEEPTGCYISIIILL